MNTSSIRLVLFVSLACVGLGNFRWEALPKQQGALGSTQIVKPAKAEAAPALAPTARSAAGEATSEPQPGAPSRLRSVDPDKLDANIVRCSVDGTRQFAHADECLRRGGRIDEV